MRMENSPPSLYDLNEDRGEQNNLAGQYPGRLSQMLEEMLEQDSVLRQNTP